MYLGRSENDYSDSMPSRASSPNQENLYSILTSFTMMLLALYLVIKIYLALKTAFPIQAPVIGEQRAGHGAANPRRAVQKSQRNRETVNLCAAGNRARPQEHDERLS